MHLNKSKVMRSLWVVIRACVIFILSEIEVVWQKRSTYTLMVLLMLSSATVETFRSLSPYIRSNELTTIESARGKSGLVLKKRRFLSTNLSPSMAKRISKYDMTTYFNKGEQIWSAAALHAVIFSSREYFFGSAFAVLLLTAFCFAITTSSGSSWIFNASQLNLLRYHESYLCVRLLGLFGSLVELESGMSQDI